MRLNTIWNVLLLASAMCVALPARTAQSQQQASTVAVDPLPSWKEGAAKQSIIAFVAVVTEEGGKDQLAGFIAEGGVGFEPVDDI